jgi:alpha-tubulin suppressor-like RCC1 family protein
VAASESFGSVRFQESTPCALTTGGVTYCWGYNDFGQVGDSTGANRNLPTPMSVPMPFVDVTTGRGQACGITTTGEVYCWGRNLDGELGIADTVGLRLVPTPVAGALRYSAISAGAQATCALAVGGNPYCWGYDGLGAIADSVALVNRLEPTTLAGGQQFIQISLGHFAGCGLTSDGDAYCWGTNYRGTVGDGTQTDRYVPTIVAGNHTFRTIAAGESSVCGIDVDGHLYCWGGNEYGQVGDGTREDRLLPTLIHP